MLLSNIVEVLEPKEVILLKKNSNIKYITSNSKLVRKNSIYVFDRKKNVKKIYIKEAIENGATAILTNKKIKDINLSLIIVNNLSEVVDIILNLLKPFPPKNIIGITGTNGKTSVVWLVSNIISLCGSNVKSLGTLGFYKNIKKISSSILTTPEKEELHQFSYSSSFQNQEFIFEISSHAISKNRIKNLPINVAAITNISQDHLDFHKNFKNYKKTKFKLFTKYLSEKGTAIINDNIKGINYLKNILKKNNAKIITYGKNKSDISCINTKKGLKIKIYSKFYLVKLFKINNFELENISCSICCCLSIGINISKIINLLNKISKPDGRMQFVNSLYNEAKVYVDYAHTPNALKNILESNNYKSKKPSLVFGCGGNRDKNKRELMGKIANKYAKKIYITDDNPRNENPDNIRKTINFYCPRAYNIGNRKKAIQTAIKNLKTKEILIIAGKGHEKKQIIKNKTINFDDVKIANNFIKKINIKKNE